MVHILVAICPCLLVLIGSLFAVRTVDGRPLMTLVFDSLRTLWTTEAPDEIKGAVGDRFERYRMRRGLVPVPIKSDPQTRLHRQNFQP